MLAITAALALAAATAQPAPARASQDMPADAEMTAMIEAADARLFYAVFEGCQPEVIADMALPEYRMIHDLGGLAVASRDAFVASMTQQCADRAPGGKNAGYRNRRLLVPGTRTIRRMGDWGAMENGDHVFFELRQRPAGTYDEDDPGGPAWVMVGGASYTHLWQWIPEDARFRLSESISYDHGPAPEYPPEQE